MSIPETVVVGKQTKPAEEQLGLAKKWIQDCQRNHSHCGRSPGKLPTRVIDVGVVEKQEPVLVETKPESIAHYMTLSHCWGIKPVIRTTKATLQSHLTELPLGKLPNTFRDAIVITRRLGIRYLWIDSLCIIQDDASDWERESAVMGQIYASSYLTIAASASRDSSGGCFLPRPRAHHARIKCTLENGDVGYVFLRPKTRGFYDLEACFLQTRAWVGQERLLSPRSLHFDQDQILWECKDTRITEDGIPVSDDTGQRDILAWDGRFKLKYPYKVSGSASLEREFVWDWYSMLENYTARNLTNPDDKLPALSGIANIMISRINDRYIAGLWESHLNIGMLWQRSSKSPWLKRPPKWRAPSWSWASLDGTILMPSEQYIESSMNPFTPTLTAIDVEIQPLGLDPHGRLAFGAVTLTGRLKRINSRVNPSSAQYAPYPESGIGQDHIWVEGESVGHVNYDEDFEENNQELYCLQMTEVHYPKRIICHVLVLSYTGKNSDYKRIGLGTTGGGEVREGWFADSELKRIRIL